MINTINKAATTLDEYEDALRRIINARTVEEAAGIALIALM